MTWTHDAHGNILKEVISLTPRGGGNVQHVAESVVHFSDVTFRVSTSGERYRRIRNGGKRAVCAWLRGTITGIEPVGDPFRFENDPTWARVSFNPTIPGPTGDKLFHIKENGQRGADVTSAPAAVYVASSQFDNPTKCRVYIPRPN